MLGFHPGQELSPFRGPAVGRLVCTENAAHTQTIYRQAHAIALIKAQFYDRGSTDPLKWFLNDGTLDPKPSECQSCFEK